MAATYHSIISTVKLHGCSVGSYLGKFFKKSLRGAGIILHSYPLVSDWSSPQCLFTIEFLTKSIKVGTEKCLLFGVCPKLTAYTYTTQVVNPSTSTVPLGQCHAENRQPIFVNHRLPIPHPQIIQ